MNPEDIKFHKEHTWVKIEDRKATVGITDYAQESLGDIVYIDAPELDADIEVGTELTQIESTKATSSVISPVTGTVVKINEELADSPEIINEEPYGKGWIAILDIEDESQIDGLMDSATYEKYLEEEVKLK